MEGHLQIIILYKSSFIVKTCHACCFDEIAYIGLNWMCELCDYVYNDAEKQVRDPLMASGKKLYGFGLKNTI